ncbi:helix-turn-helix domain-containing protein [Streptomyces sp. NBC_01775]|uniref:helix-turn-helix domain-containing protein n=1 Tax=Streptomyces sp. NBC_01775 TaxID=2975939 RepID=UPI002DDBB59D|nr:helix-turn-helix transcriptional regulator [Streptomyces sp. NBC_01775]WSB78344.1 helix-turn-helix domain-containing protein [Streptomyces sp. NBC_01775]
MPEETDNHIGARVREVRKRRGMSQRDLADTAGLSLSLIRKLEQGDKQGVRLETAHMLARALDVPTTRLVSGESPAWSPPLLHDTWRGVVHALEAPPAQLSEEPTESGVSGALAGGRSLFAAEQYADLGRMLPALIRDVHALNDGTSARRLHYQVLSLCVSFLGQVRQYAAAADAAQRAVEAATDELDGGAAVVAQCQQMLRGGRLADVAELASRWADDVEPRISRATPEQLTVWGGLQLRVGAAAVRDNRPGEAADAIRLAQIAAVRLGRERLGGPDHLRHFGPVTVTHQRAEHAAIQRRPEHVLRLHDAVRVWRPARGGGKSGRFRHLLDVADAHLRMHDDAECMHILYRIHDDAPQWLVAQRYAQDILERVLVQRRTLTPEMRDLADAVGVPL